ncbi:hypothetical protein C8R43DRAFT_960917 [Mycena crocata]|nr:hypothetical protein C8R43DRAFT_960917 [Mycena crocata]
MTSPATVPQDIQFQLLRALSDFKDLDAVVLTAHPLHNAFQANRRKVFSSVGRNFLGSLFTDALLLARCQEKRDGSAALKVKGLSPTTVRLLVDNAEMVTELQVIVFGLLQDPEIVDPSQTESTRFKAAAYRFCVYCLLQTAESRLAFLNRYPKIQILELSHFATGLWTLVSVIRGRPLDTDADWDLVSRVMSTGPPTVLDLWKMKRAEDPQFRTALKDAARTGTGNDDFMTDWCDLVDEHRHPPHVGPLPDLKPIGSAILDRENAQLVEALRVRAEAEAAAAAAEEENAGAAGAAEGGNVNGKGKGRGRGRQTTLVKGGMDDPFD